MKNVLRSFGMGLLSLAFLAGPALAGNGDQVRQQKRDGSCGNCPAYCPNADCPRNGPGCGQGRCWRGGQGQGPSQAPAQAPAQGAKPAPAQNPPAK